MARIVFVTGGCRSGKSAYAQQLAERLSPSRLYVATCPVIDDEMRCRVEIHQRARLDRGWETVEEQIDLPGVLKSFGQFNTVLIDCLTLWVNNLMYQAEHAAETMPSSLLTESDVVECCRLVLDAACERAGTVIFVSNEVGMGIVPENADARRFRDLAGRANQVMAAQSDEVTLMVSGIAWQLKGNPT